MPGSQPSDRVPEWLQGLPTAPQDAPPQNQPRENPGPGAQHANKPVDEAVDGRNSLEVILRNDPLAQGHVPEAIGLPLAGASSTTSDEVPAAVDEHGVHNRTSQSSLEALSRAAVPEIPSDIPLPEPDPTEAQMLEEAATRQASPGEATGPAGPVAVINKPLARRRRPPARLTYKQILDNAAKVLDHIKDGSVRQDSRYNKASITYYDYADDMMSEARWIEDPDDIPPLGHAPPKVKQRLIFVEDLSKEAIDALGITFSINPEFFEEHLLNANYAGANYNQPPARMWKTASLAKSYISFRWIRPVYRQPTYFSSRDLKDLLEDRTEHFTHRGKVTTRVTTNIFRLDWGLWTDPNKTVRMERECGLEERVSIWKGSLQGRDCDIVIVLLDPLPEIKEDHQLWGPNEVSGQSDDAEDDWSDRSLPESDLMEEGFGGLFGAEPLRVRDGRSLSRLWADYVVRRRRRRIEIVDDESKADMEQPDEPGKVIIEQIAPRQAVTVDLDKVFRASRPATRLGSKLNETRSTRAELCDALGRHDGPVSLVGPLLEIIRRDTLTLLQQLRRILDEVEIDLLDDRKMEDRLVLWRQLISRGQRELPDIKASMAPLRDFLGTIEPPNVAEERSNEQSNIVQDFQKLPEDIDRIIERLRAVAGSLTSNMGLLDSRRSIDEAHAVTRLTELAFIFIPLSFATSVFGMQIEPFANPVPLWNFFVVAVVVTLFAYLMRMTMRSQWLSYLKAGVKSDVRKYAEKHGQPVQSRSLPMLLIFQWLANRTSMTILQLLKWMAGGCVWVGRGLWRVFGFAISFILIICVVSAVPVAVVCTRDLASDIKIPISIGIVIVAFSFIGVPFWHNSEPGFRNALPNLVMRGIKNVPHWAQIVSAVLVLLAIFIAIPLVLIWTRPLALGIKSGLTVGIVAVVILTIAMIVFWWITARRYDHYKVRKRR
ncbi:Mg2+ transporter protein CorA-like/Zinc transport protein ZntB [Penicillium hispanicum]|uniref:Mg2+ transporter protein CorA-like/Zinc transport protein ZntB n=1 Tax=Penicillium hispanicum TaxID=1080232 RepID=UPI0025415358|nr:Mg2+ transporter protein CorA-like/Zinc transport protein ZntB [Penicillium hispanicum]KAJ5584352.1 Mg2+ transporter protein CorA-like/Zinc transport protein ZntB [Penicillium hispanicum]